MKKRYIVLIVIFLLIFALYLVRTFSSREIDDVNPLISCEQGLIEKSDVLWVIPLYKNESIANNSSWCNSILSMNKKLGMHGVYHTYHEFSEKRDEFYIQEGTDAFEGCFWKRPDSFKAPMLALSSENRLLVEMQGMTTKGRINQLLHKVYHCNDEGQFPNWMIDLF